MKPTSLRAQNLANALSVKALRDLLGEMRRAMTEDDELVSRNRPPLYGVRVYADFREWCNALENALDRRQEQYTPVDWS